jgi:hypothetical protein
MKPIREDFHGDLHPALMRLEEGTGHIERGTEPDAKTQTGGVRLVLDPNPGQQYSNAQIDDYLRGKGFTQSPPLRMTVRAWASHGVDELRGTAGFGFWTQPVLPGRALPVLPRAVWFFFSSEHSNMAFAQGVPGNGWKAATFDAGRLPFLLLAPAAPLGFLLMRVPALYRALWPVGQWAIGISEKLVNVNLQEPHTYRLDWLPASASFYVDGDLVHRTPFAPRGSLGFVTWLDNRYAIITPQGQLAMGLVPVPEREWLALESLVIEPI